MSPTARAAQLVLATGTTATAAARRFGIAAAGVRRAVRAARSRRLARLPRIDLALALVASGCATTRRAAAIHGLRAEDVLAAWNARNPGMRRVWT